MSCADPAGAAFPSRSGRSGGQGFHFPGRTLLRKLCASAALGRKLRIFNDRRRQKLGTPLRYSGKFVPGIESSGNT